MEAIQYSEPEEFAQFLSRLRSFDQLAVQIFLQGILDGEFVPDNRWVKLLPDGLWQLRIGPSTSRVRTRLALGSGLPADDGPLLIRVFLTWHEGKLHVLAAYDKALDPSRATQQEWIEVALQRANSLGFER